MHPPSEVRLPFRRSFTLAAKATRIAFFKSRAPEIQFHLNFIKIIKIHFFVLINSKIIFISNKIISINYYILIKYKIYNFKYIIFSIFIFET